MTSSSYAARVWCPQPGHSTEWRRYSVTQFDTDDGTIDRIAARIDQELLDDDYDDKDWDILHDNATFLGNNNDRMRYVSLRAAGLPVGSGVTEGACRSVIGERTKRASRRWKQEGLDAVLALRSIYSSDRLPRFFTHFRRLYTANLEEAA